MVVPRSPHPQKTDTGQNSRARKTEVALIEAIALLHRLVDHQDDECTFDHHGLCRAHFVDGSQPGKCGAAEARAWLAEHDTATCRACGWTGALAEGKNHRCADASNARV